MSSRDHGSLAYAMAAEVVEVEARRVIKVSVCGAVIRKRVVETNSQGGTFCEVSFSNAFDPLGREWKTEDAALNCTIGASTKDRVE